MKAREHRHQAATTAGPVPRYYEPWTPEDDLELLHGTGPLVERAARLGRTYWAARYRLARLRATRSGEEAVDAR